MSYVGFVFSDGELSWVIFIESSRITSSCIIGFSSVFKSESIQKFSYLSKELEFQEYFYLDSSRLPYGKISVSKKNSIYFDDLTIWLDPITYKHLWSLLHVEELSYDRVVVSTNQIIELLDL